MTLKKNHMSRFNYFIENKMNKPFEWGTWDCCVFSADAIKMMTGEDKMEAFRGTYDSRLGAARMLREKGKGTLVKTLRDIFGEEIHLSRVLAGDVVIINNNVGICTGTRAAFVAEDGLIWIPTEQASHCFSIR